MQTSTTILTSIQASTDLLPLFSSAKPIKTTMKSDTLELRFAGKDDKPSRKKLTFKKRFWTILASSLFVTSGLNIASPILNDTNTVGAETQQDNIEAASNQADAMLLPDLTLMTNDAKADALQRVAEAIDTEVLAYMQQSGSDIEIKAVLTELAPALMKDPDHAEAIDLILSEVQGIVTPGDTESFARLLLTHSSEFGISDSDLTTYLEGLDAFADQSVFDETQRSNGIDAHIMLALYALFGGAIAKGNASDNRKKLEKMKPDESPKKPDNDDPDEDLNIKSFD